MIAKDPDAAAASLSAIESSAREALDELHGLLDTLRGDTGPVDVAAAASAEPAVTSTSTRGIDRIDEFVAESVAAGLPTELSRSSATRTRCPPVVDLNTYRIAQEALTNVRKHAGAAATADVRVR